MRPRTSFAAAAFAFAGVSLLISGCAAEGRVNLTGRELCWPSTEQRLATLMRGELHLGVYPWYLDTPEGDRFQIDFAGLSLTSTADAVVDGNGNNVGNEGELVTVFGGLDADGVILVCSIDERHPG